MLGAQHEREPTAKNLKPVEDLIQRVQSEGVDAQQAVQRIRETRLCELKEIAKLIDGRTQAERDQGIKRAGFAAGPQAWSWEWYQTFSGRLDAERSASTRRLQLVQPPLQSVPAVEPPANILGELQRAVESIRSELGDVGFLTPDLLGETHAAAQ